MVGFALAHTAPGIFLLGIFFLPFGLLFLFVMVVFGLFKKLRFSRSEWLLLGTYASGFVFLSVPYSAWKRMDMKVCSSGPLGDDFLQVAALCQAHNVPLSGHTAPALHTHVSCAVTPFKNLEYFYDHVRIERMFFDGLPELVDGELRPDLSRAGMGLELKRADVERFAA